MAPMASFFLFFFSLTLVFITRAQDRAPHGLVYENPVAFSPSAFDFFHPKTQAAAGTKSMPCSSSSSSSCSPLPMAAEVQATQAEEISQVPTTRKGRSGLGAGGIAGIVLGSAFIVVAAMGVYYVLITRRANINKANSVKPDA